MIKAKDRDPREGLNSLFRIACYQDCWLCLINNYHYKVSCTHSTCTYSIAPYQLMVQESGRSRSLGHTPHHYHISIGNQPCYHNCPPHESHQIKDTCHLQGGQSISMVLPQWVHDNREGSTEWVYTLCVMCAESKVTSSWAHMINNVTTIFKVSAQPSKNSWQYYM